MARLTIGQQMNRAYRAQERGAARALREGHAVEGATLSDGTTARAGDVVEWYRVNYHGPDNGLVTVKAIAPNGFLLCTYEREMAFGGTCPAESLVDAAFLRAAPAVQVAS